MRLQTRLDQVLSAIAGLERQKALEREVAKKDPAKAITYGAFLKTALARTRELEKERETAQAAVELAQTRLAELYEEQKRYEIAETNRIESERREENRRQTIELDEIGGITHQRRKSS